MSASTVDKVATSTTQRQCGAGRYLTALFALAIIPLCIFASLKYLVEDRFAPTSRGIHGALSHPESEILFIGSSHTRRSYRIDLMEKQIHMPGFLVSYDGTDLVTISQELQQICTRYTPKYVVIEAYGAFLASRHDLQDPRLFFDAPPKLKTEISRSYFETHKTLSGAMNILALFVNRGNEEIITYPIDHRLQQSLSYRGGVRNVFIPGSDVASFNSYRSGATSDVPDAGQIAALHEMIDFARARHISLIFIDPPMPAPVIADAKIQRLKQVFRTTLTSLSQTYIDGDDGFPTENPELFMDNNHLSSAGCELFTLRSSQAIEAWMSSTVSKGGPNESGVASAKRQLPDRQ